MTRHQRKTIDRNRERMAIQPDFVLFTFPPFGEIEYPVNFHLSFRFFLNHQNNKYLINRFKERLFGHLQVLID